LTTQPLPGWVHFDDRAGKGAPEEEPGDIGHASREPAFTAGAALFALDQIFRAEPVFLGAWRMRIALHAAVSASRLLRARADEAELRDSLYLTRAGDEPGLAGRAHRLLRRFTKTPVRLANATLEELAELSKGDGPVEIRALLREDLALAEQLGWRQPLPLHLVAIHDPAFRRGEEGRRLRIGEPGWGANRSAIVARAAIMAHAEAVTLSRRAEVLIAAAGTLRTRDGEAGLALILNDDCVAPWRMAGEVGIASRGMSSDRAARRFCETLHARGALRLLTPRAAFRLYGL
jgi:hypothetical protein